MRQTNICYFKPAITKFFKNTNPNIAKPDEIDFCIISWTSR